MAMSERDLADATEVVVRFLTEVGDGGMAGVRKNLGT